MTWFPFANQVFLYCDLSCQGELHSLVNVYLVKWTEKHIKEVMRFYSSPYSHHCVSPLYTKRMLLSGPLLTQSMF